LSSAPARGLEAAVWAVVMLGAALRAWQYVAGGSLWLDEVALARGILDPPLGALLTQPLPYAQIAPKGFLLIEKLAAQALGGGDLALRLYPFLASLAALFAFRALALRVLDGAGALIALVLFALAPCLIHYGANLKQYASDVAIAAGLLWLAHALALRAPTAPRSALAAAAGAIAVWLSQPALLVQGGVAAAAVLLPRVVLADPSRWRALFPVWLAWGVSGLAAAAVSLASVAPDVLRFQAQSWDEGYPPSPLRSPLDLLWPIGRMSSLYGGPSAASLGYPVRALFLALTALGAVALWRHNRRSAVLLLAPLCAALAAAWLRRYSFEGRLILFLVPVFLLALAAGIAWLRRLASARAPRLGDALAAALVLLAVAPVVLRPPPYSREDVAPVLEQLRYARQPGDAIYVFYGAAAAVAFYAERYGLRDDDYVVGGCHRGRSRRYLAELDHFRGRPRVWLLVAHASRHSEREDLIAYLDALGTRRAHVASHARLVEGIDQPFEAFLYDLSDAQRLASVSAQSFALRGPESDGHEPCTGPIALVPGELQARR
jgi:hypothetical protein